jgi:hypothetical protein
MTFYPVKIKDLSKPTRNSTYAFGVYVKNGEKLEYVYENQSAYDLGKNLGKVEEIKKNSCFAVNYTPPLHADLSMAESYGGIIDYRVYEMSEQGKEEFIKGLKDALGGKG